MQLPLSIGLRTMATASCAYSSGRPMRRGNALSRVSSACISGGASDVIPVSKRLGAIATERMPSVPRSRAIGSIIAATPAFAAVYAT